MRKKTTMYANGKEYKVVIDYFGYGIISVEVYEIVRPTWKIFRTPLFSIGYSRFFLNDFPTIEEGVEHSFLSILETEREENEENEKLKDYFG